MLGTSARLLRLLTLLQSRGFWSGAELADRLEVTERTVRRDVDRLRSLGYPVNSSVGVAGGYQLGAGASLPPLHLDDDEALAVSLGLRTAAVGNVVGVEQAAVRAMAKLEQVLPKKASTPDRRAARERGPDVHRDATGPPRRAVGLGGRVPQSPAGLVSLRRRPRPHDTAHDAAARCRAHGRSPCPARLAARRR